MSVVVGRTWGARLQPVRQKSTRRIQLSVIDDLRRVGNKLLWIGRGQIASKAKRCEHMDESKVTEYTQKEQNEHWLKNVEAVSGTVSPPE